MAKAKKEISNDIESLDPIEHLRRRPGMWLGSMALSENLVWSLDENDNLTYKKVLFTPALRKIIDEAIDNAIDEGIKTDWKHSNKITISIDKNQFTIEDNGRGIPVKKDANGDWQCVNAVCKLMTGSNFSDDERNTIGMNGVGIKGLNAFSKKFECVTCDGKGKMKIICEDNLTKEKHTELTPTAKTGTKITSNPDFAKFGVKEFSNDLIMLVKTRLKFLSWFYPECTFTFNGEKIIFKVKDFTSLFPSPAVMIEEPNAYICVYPTDEPFILSYVNGIYLPEGGNHVEYITNNLVSDIREKVSKKFKNIKPADIKNRLGITVFFKNFSNCIFNSQTKEKLTNPQSDITAFLNTNNIDLSKLSAKVLKEKEIIENITDIFKAKEDLAEQKALAKQSKVVKNFESDKYFPPSGKSKKKYLMITEGFSAFSGISPILGRQDIGYYMLKGKPLNVLDLKPSKFMENREISELVKILGIDLANPDTDMLYDKVVVLSDADSDGTAIAGLIITLFSRIAPKMLKEGRVCRMETPLLIGLKGDKVEDYYFEFPEKSKMKKTLNYMYMKGLGSWTKSRLNQVLDKEGGMDMLLRAYALDKEAKNSIENWFGSDSEPRKKALRGREFHIDNA